MELRKDDYGMELTAILHRPMSEYAFPLDSRHMVFRLRSKREDLKEVTFWYADRADMSSELPFTPKEMPLVRRDMLYDWFEITLETDWERIAYYFELNDGKEKIRFAGEVFEKENAHIERSEYFQYPYNHRADIPQVPEWIRSAVVYNIFPDSFADSARHISGEAHTAEYRGLRCESLNGGTIRGITENLDYLQELGFNCIYLNPVFTAGAYHKYDLLDYKHIDPCFGSDDEFREMVRQAHEHGIRVILDGVFNHVSQYHFSFQDVLKNGKGSDYYDWFYSLPDPVRVPKDDEMPGYTCFSYVANMPKTDTSCPALRDYFCDVGTYWIREFDTDGWRLDVANEVNDDFLRCFRKSVRSAKPDAIIIGEVWENAEHYMHGDMLDGAMNYDFRRFCTQFFAERILTAEEFDLRLSSLMMRYSAKMLPAQLNLLDGHDTCRFLTSCGGDLSRMEQAILFQMTFVGIPSVFYGDEKGMTGLTEPEYRAPMNWNDHSELENVYGKMISLRREHPALTGSSFKTVSAADGLFEYEREDGNEVIRIAINTGAEEKSVIPVGDILLQKGVECGLLKTGGYLVSRRVK